MSEKELEDWRDAIRQHIDAANKLRTEKDELITALDMAQATLRNDMFDRRVTNALSIIDEALAEVDIPEPEHD